MINLDNRILDKELLNESEFWLLMHIVKRINKDRKSFPGNETLCKDTGFGINRILRIKKSLLQKGLLQIKQRKFAEGKFGSNEYTVNTDLISIFIPVSAIKMQEASDGSTETVQPNRCNGTDGSTVTVQPNRLNGTDSSTETVQPNRCNGTETVQPKQLNGSVAVPLNQLNGEVKTVPPNQLNEVLVLDTSNIEVLVPVCISHEEKISDTHTPKKKDDFDSLKSSTASPPPSSAAPPPESATLFRETKYVPDGFSLFEADMIARNGEYAGVDLEYYYHKVLNWSDEGNRRKNWLASAGTFILNDRKENKLQIKSHGKQTSIPEDATINGYSAHRALEYYERILRRNRQ